MSKAPSSDYTGKGSSTRSVHGGEPRVRGDRSITTPTVQASAYPFAETSELVAFMEGRIDRPHEYGRYGNPTVAQAEAKLAAIEGAQSSVLMSSGMAAITTTLMAILQPGQHIVLTSDVYRRTRQFANTTLKKYGIEVSIVEPNVAAIEAACQDNTRVIFTEAPTNPYLRVVDIEALVCLAKAKIIKTIVDATFGTPINLQPIDWGVDIVIHSATKYLGGHNDLLAGVVLGNRGLISAINESVGVWGPVCDANTAYLLLRGLKTLSLRVKQQNDSGLRMARRLEAHPQVKRVWYPLLESHPDHAMATKYMSGGGGVLSFDLMGGLAAGTAFIDRLEIPKIAPSFGGVESLIEQPALMSFFELTPEQRKAVGISEGLIRFSSGIEDYEDLEMDIVRSLDALT